MILQIDNLIRLISSHSFKISSTTAPDKKIQRLLELGFLIIQNSYTVDIDI